FKKYQVRASVEYKTSGWVLSEDRRYLTFTDKFQASPLSPLSKGRAVSFSVQKCDRQILKAFLCKEKEDYFNSFEIFCLNRA
ncbi:MAG: hypothetical protein WAN66_15065, partial [Limnoraphis robusta]